MVKKRILITGASGMLGSTLVDLWKKHFDIYSTQRHNFNNNPSNNSFYFDLLNNNYDKLLKWSEPDIIVHCAAITDVDFCEKNFELAKKVNGESVKKLLSKNSHARLIFISSDSVFSDEVSMPIEKHKPDPINAYGMSKYIGEKHIKDAGKPHVSVRTTIVGKNINSSKVSLVEWIINSVKNKKEITLFEDALFSPITIWHLANELKWIIENDVFGIYHISGNGIISKYEFGYRICKGLGLDTSLIRKGSIDDISFNAKRSKDQTLDCSHYSKIFGRVLPNMDETLDIIIKHYSGGAYA
tara:strand:- start:2467 stop:3363 length:897 start_codon:yes stop_codon:yes gene_type:complete